MHTGTLNYQEQSLTTTDTKFAAALLVFGYKLKQHNPITWKNEFGSKAQYLAWKKAPSRENAPTEKADWNFEVGDSQKTQWLFKGFNSQDADQTLAEVLTRLVPDSKDRNGLNYLIDACMAQACREVLERREFLIRLLKSVPRDAQWMVVKNDTGQVAMFGVNASIETQTEYLSLL
jgi:hypothetical protein